METFISEFSAHPYFAFIIQQLDFVKISVPVTILIGLIICSGLISGSEVAFFSISSKQVFELKSSTYKYHQAIINLLKGPRVLLGTILIANNIINIAIVLLFTIISAQVFDFGSNPVLAFLIDVVAITFILVLLGEVIPKVYANQLNIGFASFMAIPMFMLNKVLYPLSISLVSMTSLIEKRINKRGHDLSIEDLKKAIDITSEEAQRHEDKQMLKGIVNFSNTTVKQIMTSRVDTVAYSIDTPLSELVEQINENRYSRLPVYEDSLDNVKGVLYIKDLIPNLNKEDSFNWQKLLRKPYFVPQNKKIDDLLREFQTKKVHFAIVVDEYGGASGIITMEDILEEIVGDINDEFDEEDVFYSKLDDSNYVFDGKTPITDLTRIISISDDYFDYFRSDIETIGGLIVEIAGRIPRIGEVYSYSNLEFKIESADRKRVRRVKITIHNREEAEE